MQGCALLLALYLALLYLLLEPLELRLVLGACVGADPGGFLDAPREFAHAPALVADGDAVELEFQREAGLWVYDVWQDRGGGEFRWREHTEGVLIRAAQYAAGDLHGHVEPLCAGDTCGRVCVLGDGDETVLYVRH